jgi:IclR family transcriptional regulator, acetate operon repressor
MSAMSAPVRTQAGNVLGVVTIAGPMSRLPEERMLQIGPSLMATAAEIAESSGASSLFRVKAA